MATLSATATEIDKKSALRQIESLLDRALSADEAGKIGDALTLYIKAEIDANNLAQRLGPVGDEKLRERLNIYQANIVSRKELLSESLDAALPAAPSAPPAYTEMPAPPSRSMSRPPVPASSHLMMSLPNVQICSVSGEGQVSVPSYPDILAVRRLEDGTPFLQIGDWSTPLIQGETPTLITGEALNTMMLPDPDSLNSKDSIAILLPPNLKPNDKEKFMRMMRQLTRMMISVDGQVREITENDLQALVGVQRRESYTIGQENGDGVSTRQGRRISWPREGESSAAENGRGPDGRTHTSDLVAGGIQTTTELLARGLKWGAEKGSGLIRRGGDAWRSHIEQSRTATGQSESYPVDPRLTQGAQVARSGTHKVVDTSAKAVGYLGSAAKSLATWATPHVKRGAQQVLPKSWMESSPGGRSKVDSTLTVASASLVGLKTVYEALEHSAILVGRATADGTAGVVGARYGSPAGNVTSNVLYSVGNVGLTVNNIRHFGIKAVAKTVATEGVHCAREDVSDSNNGQSRSQAPR